MEFPNLLPAFFLLLSLLSCLTSSQAQSTSILNRIFNPFNWFTVKSNSSAVVIDHNDEVPVKKTQVVPLIVPSPLPVLVHTLSEKFDTPPKADSPSNIHLPLQVTSLQVVSSPSVMPASIPPSVMSPPSQTMSLQSILKPVVAVSSPMVAPLGPRPMRIMKRVGQIISKSEARVEEDVAETMAPENITSAVLSTTVKSSELATITPEAKAETYVTNSTVVEAMMMTTTEVPTTNLFEHISTSHTSENGTAETTPVTSTDKIDTSTNTNKELLETTTTITNTKSEEGFPQPVFIPEKVNEVLNPKVEKAEVEEELVGSQGEFLYESDFARYLNQFYYSKPTVFDNLQMSNRHTPIFDTMKF